MIKKCKYSNYFFNCTLNIKILFLLSSTVGLNTLPSQYYFEVDNLHHRYHDSRRKLSNLESREIELGNSKLFLNGTKKFINFTCQQANNQLLLQLNDRHYAYFCPNGTVEVKTIKSILLNLEDNYLKELPADLAALIDGFCQSEDQYEAILREHFLLHKNDEKGEKIICSSEKTEQQSTGYTPKIIEAFQQNFNPGALISIKKNGEEFGEIIYDKKLILVSNSVGNHPLPDDFNEKK